MANSNAFTGRTSSSCTGRHFIQRGLDDSQNCSTHVDLPSHALDASVQAFAIVCVQCFAKSRQFVEPNSGLEGCAEKPQPSECFVIENVLATFGSPSRVQQAAYHVVAHDMHADASIISQLRYRVRIHTGLSSQSSSSLSATS